PYHLYAMCLASSVSTLSRRQQVRNFGLFNIVTVTVGFTAPGVHLRSGMGKPFFVPAWHEPAVGVELAASLRWFFAFRPLILQLTVHFSEANPVADRRNSPQSSNATLVFRMVSPGDRMEVTSTTGA